MKIMATHTIGSVRKLKHAITAGASILVYFDRDHFVVKVTLKSQIGNLPQVPQPIANDIYSELEDWLVQMIRNSNIQRVILPGTAINGVWPSLEQLANSIQTRLGVEVLRD